MAPLVPGNAGEDGFVRRRIQAAVLFVTDVDQDDAQGGNPHPERAVKTNQFLRARSAQTS